MRAHACDVIQGYHVSRPLAADAFTEFLLAWGRKHGPRLVAVKGSAA
jgi:EAL domain-containing protein (putative c-di-GMP-specific phosphodiesterase class I)